MIRGLNGKCAIITRQTIFFFGTVQSFNYHVAGIKKRLGVAGCYFARTGFHICPAVYAQQVFPECFHLQPPHLIFKIELAIEVGFRYRIVICNDNMTYTASDQGSGYVGTQTSCSGYTCFFYAKV
jgi:hypothetical protein